MTIDVRALGARITTLRSAQGESITAFAKRTGLARSHMYKLESGNFESPSLATLDALADAFGLTIDQLVGRRSPDKAMRRPVEPPVPITLIRFVREWESRHKTRMPKDAVHSLARLRFRGKRPRNAKDWGVIYAVVDSLLRE